MDRPFIRLLATGGTIDEDSADPTTGKSLFSHSHVPEMLGEAGISSGVIVEKLMLKDSSDITEEDRKQILERCASCPEKRVVITHGTHTMVETAMVLGKDIHNKTVVLVGSFIPFVRKGSDAMENLKYAFEQVKRQPSGVYIAMNGKVFPWNNVQKNREKLVFENLKKTVE